MVEAHDVKGLMGLKDIIVHRLDYFLLLGLTDEIVAKGNIMGFSEIT